MTETNGQPPMAWRYCGNQIKRWRMQAGISREELGKEAGYEYETISSVEQGRRRPSTHLLKVADEMCDAHGLIVAAEEYLKPEKFASFSQDFMRYEADAKLLNSYEPLLIPGLLQTEATARALISADCPPVDDETLETRVSARIARSAMLDDQRRAFSFVIGELALRYPVASPADHVEQLRHIVRMGTRRHITVQVLPWGGAHPGLNGPLVLLETADHQMIAYEEGQSAGYLYSDAEKISVASQSHAMLLRRALSPAESARFIERLTETP